jgi:antitoxin (DNA-binding transcriptional repressor) of toxin-antitoxin stability system
MVMSEYRTVRANLAQVNEHLSAYVTRAEHGDTVIVCRRNRPVAELVAVGGPPPENETKPGSAEESVVVKCDLTEPAIRENDWSVLR